MCFFGVSPPGASGFPSTALPSQQTFRASRASGKVEEPALASVDVGAKGKDAGAEARPYTGKRWRRKAASTKARPLKRAATEGKAPRVEAARGAPARGAHAGWHAATPLDERLVYVEGDGDAILGIPTVIQVIAVPGVVYIHIVVVVPVVGPVFRPRVNQTEPKTAVAEAAMPANVHHGKTLEAEPVIMAVVAAETGLRNAVAAVTAALLPGAVLRLPATRTFMLPSSPLLAFLSRVAMLCRPIGLLLPLLLLALLILPRPGLFLLPLLLLALLILPTLGLFLLPLLLLALLVLPSLGLFLLPLLLLALLILPTLGLLLLFGSVVLLLALLVLPTLGLLLLLLSCGLGVLLLLCGFSLLLLFRLSLWFLFPLVLLLRARRNSDSEKQKQSRGTDDSSQFHDVASITAYSCARRSSWTARRLFPIVDSGPWPTDHPSAVHPALFTIPAGFARENGRLQKCSTATIQHK